MQWMLQRCCRQMQNQVVSASTMQLGRIPASRGRECTSLSMRTLTAPTVGLQPDIP